MRISKKISTAVFILTFLLVNNAFAKDSHRNDYKKPNTHKLESSQPKNDKKHNHGRPFQALLTLIEENKSLINANQQDNINQDQVLLNLIESNKSLIESNQTLNASQNKNILEMLASYLNVIETNHQDNISQDQLLMNMIDESKAFTTAQNQALIGLIDSNTALINNNQNTNINQDQMLLSMINDSRLLIDANRADIANLTLATSDLKLKVTSLDNEIIVIQDKVTTNENELRSVLSQLQQSNNQISLITQDLLNLSATHTADLQTVNNEIAWLKAQVSGLDQELKALAENLSKKLTDLNTAISENSIALDGLMNEILLLTAETTQITAMISSLNTAITDLEQRSSQQEQQLGILAQQFTSMGEQLATITNPASVPVNLTGVHAEYTFDNRTVYFWKTPPCADLNLFENFCQNRGLNWWRAKSQADAQKLIDYGYNLDSNHTWIQIFGVTTQKGTASGIAGLLDGFSVNVDQPACMADSTTGFTGIRKKPCSMCNPEDNNNKSCCWDVDHQYDWFVCESIN